MKWAKFCKFCSLHYLKPKAWFILSANAVQILTSQICIEKFASVEVWTWRYSPIRVSFHMSNKHLLTFHCPREVSNFAMGFVTYSYLYFLSYIAVILCSWVDFVTVNFWYRGYIFWVITFSGILRYFPFSRSPLLSMNMLWLHQMESGSNHRRPQRQVGTLPTWLSK